MCIFFDEFVNFFEDVIIYFGRIFIVGVEFLKFFEILNVVGYKNYGGL